MSVRIVAGQTKTIGVALASVANAGKFQVAPTLDAADFRISINGGSLTALTNTPTVTPSGGKRVQVIFAAAETTAAGAGGEIFLVCSDSSGNEWYDLSIPFPVYALPEDMLAINAITATAIATDAITAAKVATDALAEIADAILSRSRANVDDTASTDSLYELIATILDGDTSSGALVTKKTDGTTTFNTRTLSTNADAVPIVGVSGQ